MAEFVGLVASVAGLAGVAATVSTTLYRCSQDIINARDDFTALADDVQIVSQVLQYLSLVLQQYEDLVTAQATQMCEQNVKRCERTLEELKYAVRLVNEKYGRVKWLFRKQKAREHRLSLETCKSNLQLIIAALNLSRSLEQEREAKECVYLACC
jgi:trehalose-6-phosphate synthase